MNKNIIIYNKLILFDNYFNILELLISFYVTNKENNFFFLIFENDLNIK